MLGDPLPGPEYELETSSTALGTVNYRSYDSQRNFGQNLRNLIPDILISFLLGTFSSNSLKLFTGFAFSYEGIAIPDRSRGFFCFVLFVFGLCFNIWFNSC